MSQLHSETFARKERTPSRQQSSLLSDGLQFTQFSDPPKKEDKKPEPENKTGAPLTIMAFGNKLVESSEDPKAIELVHDIVRLIMQTPPGIGDFVVHLLEGAPPADIPPSAAAHQTGPADDALEPLPAGDKGAQTVAAPQSETIRDILRPRRVEVQILSTHPIITGWADEPKGTLVAEVVAFLATRRGCATREQLRAALYPAGISDSTLRSLLTRVRNALGPDILSSRNPLRLSDEVGCDWARFQDLFNLARNATDADKRERGGRL